MDTTKDEHVLKTELWITIHTRIKLQWNYASAQTIELLKLILTINFINIQYKIYTT